MPSIAIIGAGPAGLTLARLLQVGCKDNSISDLQITIFEKDPSKDARWFQGGTLDLHPKTGIAALKAAQMWEGILPRMRYEGEEMIIADLNGTKMVHTKSSKAIPGDYDRPEVDREVLKQALLTAVEDISGLNAVTWNKSLMSADAETGILRFKDGVEAGPYDLVVGADGAWSKIRNVVTPGVTPTYSGICGFEAFVDESTAGEHWSEIEEMVGGGSYFATGNSQSLMAQRMEDRSMKVASWVTKEASWPYDTVERHGGDDDKIRQTILDTFAIWDDKFKILIGACQKYRPWPLYELPIGHSWEHLKGFTLIGDASHLMTPFAGEGVNAAMKDALDLSTRIVTALRDKESVLDEAVQKFEQDMFQHSRLVQSKTARNKELMFRADAPIGFMTAAVDIIAEEFEYDTTKGWLWALTVPVRVLSFVYFSAVAKLGHLRRQKRDRQKTR